MEERNQEPNVVHSGSPHWDVRSVIFFQGCLTYRQEVDRVRFVDRRRAPLEFDVTCILGATGLARKGFFRGTYNEYPVSYTHLDVYKRQEYDL